MATRAIVHGASRIVVGATRDAGHVFDEGFEGVPVPDDFDAGYDEADGPQRLDAGGKPIAGRIAIDYEVEAIKAGDPRSTAAERGFALALVERVKP